MAKGHKAHEQKAPDSPPAPSATQGQHSEGGQDGGEKPTAEALAKKVDLGDLESSVVGNLEKPPEAKPADKPAAPRAPAVTKRPGLVELEALASCNAHGMPHLAGDRFFANTEVAEALLRRGSAKRV